MFIYGGTGREIGALGGRVLRVDWAAGIREDVGEEDIMIGRDGMDGAARSKLHQLTLTDGACVNCIGLYRIILLTRIALMSNAS